METIHQPHQPHLRVHSVTPHDGNDLRRVVIFHGHHEEATVWAEELLVGQNTGEGGRVDYACCLQQQSPRQHIFRADVGTGRTRGEGMPTAQAKQKQTKNAPSPLEEIGPPLLAPAPLPPTQPQYLCKLPRASPRSSARRARPKTTPWLNARRSVLHERTGMSDKGAENTGAKNRAHAIQYPRTAHPRLHLPHSTPCC